MDLYLMPAQSYTYEPICQRCAAMVLEMVDEYMADVTNDSNVASYVEAFMNISMLIGGCYHAILTATSPYLIASYVNEMGQNARLFSMQRDEAAFSTGEDRKIASDFSEFVAMKVLPQVKSYVSAAMKG